MNYTAVQEAEKNMVFAARLTQRGHAIHSMDDLLALYEKAYIIMPVVIADFVNDLGGQRGAGAFGSTGK